MTPLGGKHKKESRWANFPFAPKKSPFFYGWVILAISIVGTVASIPGQTMGVGVFTDSLLQVLGLTSIQLSIAYALGTIGSSFLLPYGGSLIDRFGSRSMAVYSTLGLGLSVAILGSIDHVTNALFGGRFLFVMATLVLVFLGMRFFGQGLMTMVARVAMGKWFNLRRGLASGIAGIFVAFSFNGSMVVLNYLVQAVGWRMACVILTGIVGVGVSFLSWLFYRDNPEECGLSMDGNISDEKRNAMESRETVIYKDFTRSEALRTLSFWAFSLGPAFNALLTTALFFHLSALAAENGISRDYAYALFIPMPFISVPVNFVGGMLSDRIPMKWLLSTMMLAMFLGTIGMIFMNVVWGQALMVFGFGFSGGLFGTIITVAFPKYFGRAHLGSLAGVNMSIIVFASAIGPVFLSAGEMFLGRFQPTVVLSLLMPVSIFLLSFIVDNPQDRYKNLAESPDSGKA